MQRKQFTGKDLDSALEKAAKEFAVEKSSLGYNILPQQSGGLFSKLFSRSLSIEAWVAVSTEHLKAAARAAVKQVLHENEESQQTDLLFKEYQEKFFSVFQVSLDQITVSENDNIVTVNAKDPFLEKILSKSDKLSISFEHLFKRISQKKGNGGRRSATHQYICLEAGESSQNREQHLIKTAQVLAEKVKKTGKSMALSSKSSQERKTIHMALDGFDGIVTRSVGTGEKRKLIISRAPEKTKDLK